MRLIDVVRTLDSKEIIFEEFIASPPKYAILFHTWEQEEVTYQDVLQKNTTYSRDVNAQGMKGLTKILKLCELAKEADIRYAWVDTCCIDKKSSAELSEAINSMYKWYENSKIAYAFISDWRSSFGAALEDIILGYNEENEQLYEIYRKELGSCRWFTRGWTLQELIAPCAIEFYDADWRMRGTKKQMELVLSDITGISSRVLLNSSERVKYPVCTRMSWAANRNTTREEDLAYSLIGLFDINMPLLYGEGRNAFIRLQEAILAKTGDLTLFAWRAHSTVEQQYRGIFARNPTEFSNMGGVMHNSASPTRREQTVTTNGIRLTADLESNNTLFLECFKVKEGQLRICLKHLKDNLYVREKPWQIIHSKGRRGLNGPREIYISADLSQKESEDLTNIRAWFLRKQTITLSWSSKHKYFYPIFSEPSNNWDDEKYAFIVSRYIRSFSGCLGFAPTREAGEDFQGSLFWVVCYLESPVGEGGIEDFTLVSENSFPGFSAFSRDPRLFRNLITQWNHHEIQFQAKQGPSKIIVSLSVEAEDRPNEEEYTKAYVLSINCKKVGLQ